MSDRSMVKVNEKPKKENKGPEQEINRVLQEEIAKINDSLAKISQCLNVRILILRFRRPRWKTHRQRS
jgi:hypothetical protein